MMALLLGDPSRPVHEIQRFPKIGETEYFMQVVLVDNLPIGNFRIQFGKSLPFQGGHSPFARYACLVGERHRFHTPLTY